MKVQAAYRKFLKTHGRMIAGAEKLMDTDAQRAAFRGAVVTAFQGGFRAPRDEPVKPVVLRKWRGRNDPQ